MGNVFFITMKVQHHTFGLRLVGRKLNDVDV
jgi:hypothetical protein